MRHNVIAASFLLLASCGSARADDGSSSQTPPPIAIPSPTPVATPTPTPSPSPSGAVALAPASGALLGHYYGAGTVAETDARIGRKPQIHLSYYGWTDHWALADATRQDIRDGRIPLVNWEPFDVDFRQIVAGKYDDLITAQADEAKALNTRFFLDFAAEMNEEEGWGDHDPALYVAAWRHIHDIFVRRGAANAMWVWCPNNVDTPGQPDAMRYYPGDSYVDWVGADGYNWGTSKEGFDWETFSDVFGPIYRKIATTGKPVMIGETASDEVGGDKAAWITQIVPTLKSQFPAIKAVVWFDVDKERHWPINSSTKSLSAYQALAKDPYFN